MPKAALYALIWSSERSIYELYEQNNGDHPLVQGGDQQWVMWLAAHTSFSFQGQHGHLNLLKEARKSGGEGYWYAYQRQGKRTTKKYVGRSAELTMARLEEIASMLTCEKRAKESLATTDLGVPQEQSVLIGGSLQVPEPVPAAPYEIPLLAPKLQLPRLHASLVSRE